MRNRLGSYRSLMFAVVTFAAWLGWPDEARADVGEKKAGPLMGNFKLAPAVGFGGHGYWGTQFAVQLEIAYAVDDDAAAYIGFNPQFQVASWASVINLTGTFQYDFELPVEGLYIYPKINAGVAIFPGDSYYYYDCDPRPGRRRICGSGSTATQAAFTLQPEVGVKFNIFKNFHVLAEPLSFPIYIGDRTFAQYRFWFGCGFDVDP